MLSYIYRYFPKFKKQFNTRLIFSSNKLTLRGVLEALAAVGFFIGVAKLPFAMVYILKFSSNNYDNLWCVIFK